MDRLVLPRIALIACAFWPWNPASAQRAEDLHVAVVSYRAPHLDTEDVRATRIDPEPAASKKPSLLLHTAIGTAVGLAVWVAYYSMPSDGDSDGAKGERLLMLPVGVGLGAAGGFTIGLLRGAQ